MNKIKSLISLLVLASAFYSNAQSFKTLSGKVIDGSTKKPLEFASIYLEHSNKGTVSNANGDFEFHFNNEAESSTVVISFIGYKNQTIDLSQVDALDAVTINMEPQSIMLEEVVVQADSMTAKEIVEKAVSKIKDNYPSEPILMESFFRETEWENDKCVQVTEAAIQLFDRKYNTKRNSFQEDIKTLGIRRSLSYRQIEGFNDLGTAIVDLIENNDVRYHNGLLKTKNYEYTLDSVSFYNNKPVYVISAENRLDRSALIIDVQSYAFIKIEGERRKWHSEDPYYFKWSYGDSLKLGRVMFKFQVEFREVDNVMYPSYMKEEELAHVYEPESGQIQIKKEERLEMVVNEVKTDITAKQFDGERISRKYKVAIGPYDQEFWAHFNGITLEPLEAEAIKDLEKEMSMTQQFTQNK